MEDLLHEMKEGLLVEDLFTSGMNNVTGDFSFGCSGFLVEKGKITAPVKEITIGGVTYRRKRAIRILKRPVKGDKTRTMFKALVSAKLNVLIGNDDSCIADTIIAADAWMAQYGPVGSKVKAKSDAWKEGEPLATTLDNYNNGLMCAPHRN